MTRDEDATADADSDERNPESAPRIDESIVGRGRVESGVARMTSRTSSWMVPRVLAVAQLSWARHLAVISKSGIRPIESASVRRFRHYEQSGGPALISTGWAHTCVTWLGDLLHLEPGWGV